MKKWLTEKNIPFDENSRNIEILRLPPYHPELNAIENIWGILKNRIASKNIAQNMTEVQNLQQHLA